MTRLFARFGLDAGFEVPNQELGYAWSDDDPYELIEEKDDISSDLFLEIGAKGHILFSNSCTELLINLLLKHWENKSARLYLDALWASSLSEQYNVPNELDHDRFEGPIEGMVGLAYLNTINTWYGADEESSALDAAFSYHCTQHVIGHLPAFKNWTLFAIARLAQACPSTEQQEEQTTLPIELICPGAAPSVEMWSDLSKSSLAVLKLGMNPFARLKTDAQ